MLIIPSYGIGRSTKEHNSKLNVVCDWIEGSVLFSESEISRSDIIDYLIEEHIYDDQSFASQFMGDVWMELRRRIQILGRGSPISLTTQRIERRCSWKEVPAHSFCLILSFSQWYPGWSNQFSSSYLEQGELFELLTKESLECQLLDWTIVQTGWSKIEANKIDYIVNSVVKELGEKKGDVENWIESDANDAGLDLLCYRPFPDKRVGIPVYLMQCASGGNWETKLKTPDIDLWEQLVRFAERPQRAFAMPFTLLDREHRMRCNNVKGMFLDRYRILTPSSKNSSWVSETLSKRLINWLNPRIKKLPIV